MSEKIYILFDGNNYYIGKAINHINGQMTANFTNDVNRCKLMTRTEIKEALEEFPKLQVRIINTIKQQR